MRHLVNKRNFWTFWLCIALAMSGWATAATADEEIAPAVTTSVDQQSRLKEVVLAPADVDSCESAKVRGGVTADLAAPAGQEWVETMEYKVRIAVPDKAVATQLELFGLADVQIGTSEFVIPAGFYGKLKSLGVPVKIIGGTTYRVLRNTAEKDDAPDLPEARGGLSGTLSLGDDVDVPVPDGSSQCVSYIDSSSAPPNAYVTDFIYTIRIDDTGDPSNFWCVDYEIYLSSDTHGVCNPTLLVYDNLGGYTDGGYDDDTDDDSDIWLDHRSTSFFNGETPNQWWDIVVTDNIGMGEGMIDYIYLTIHWATPDDIDLYDDGEAWRSFNPQTVTEGTGQPFEIHCDIRNGGSDPSGPYMVEFYASTNTIISTMDHYIGEVQMTGTAAGDWDNCDWYGNVPIGIPSGTYYIGWIIDADSDVDETNETNNTAYKEAYQLTVNPPGTTKDWTFMVYLDGDNNLETYAINDFLEMAAVGGDANINIVVQFDRIPSEDPSYGDWFYCRRFEITPGMTPDSVNALMNLGEVNMGDPATLTDFIDWATAAYPADNYALVLWNHGDGWRDATLPARAVCLDDTDGDVLEMDEVQTALNAAAIDVDLIGFDACLMAMTEVAYEIRNSGADVMVGSEHSEPAGGWPYDTILADLKASPGWSAYQLGSAIVDRYYASYGNNYTQSAVDLNQIASLGSAVNDLASTLRTSWNSNPAAVMTEAQNVKNLINLAVIHEQHGPTFGGSHGLSIYFPRPGQSIASDYNAAVIDFPADTQWESFLADFQSSMIGSWISDARNVSQEYHSTGYYDYVDLYDFCDNLNPPTTCTFTVTPLAAAFSAAGGSDTIDVTASDPGCAWSALTGTPWIVITSGAAYTGDGTVSYFVDSNIGPPRSGTIDLAGETVLITQAGASSSCNVQGMHSGDGSYSSGAQVQVCVSITYSDTLTALGVEEVIPPGWSFASVTGSDPPSIVPAVGTENLLSFAWITAPASPVEFCFTLNVPAGETGDHTVSGEVVYRCGGGGEERVTIPDHDINACGYHSADYNPADWSVNLSELLRSIQFFNLGSYHCDAAGEDGYNPGIGDHSCAPHALDYNPQDWQINLSELLRLIQFFNMGSYHCDAAGEDGYNPGISMTLPANDKDDTLTGTHAFDTATYAPGANITIDVEIQYTGSLTALGVEVTLPDGYTYMSVGGSDAPVFGVPLGNTLSLGWITPPASPIEFSYSVQVPAAPTGAQQINAVVKYRRGAGTEIVEPLTPDPLLLEIPPDGDISATPTPLDFGTITVGEFSTLPLTIENTGAGDLNVSDITLASGGGGAFSFTGPTSFTLPPGGQEFIQLTFAPTAEGSAAPDALLITSDDPDENPLNVDLIGAGVLVLPPDIVVTPAPVDFGSVTIGDSLTLPITIENIGGSALNISNITLASGGGGAFSFTGPTSFTLLTGEPQTLQATFTPASDGPVYDTLTITSDDPDENPLNVDLIGTGVLVLPPDIHVDPDPPSLDFGDVTVGNTYTMAIDVSNQGDADLNVTGITLASGGGGAFSISGPASFTLRPGESQSLDVTFAPAVNGPDSDVLTITSDDPDENPVEVALSGAGVTAATPDIEVDPTALAFGSVFIGDMQLMSLTVSNAGDADLTIEDIDLSPVGGEFGKTHPPTPFSLMPGESQMIDVTYGPTDEGSDGGELKIYSDDRDEALVVVPLSGTGIPEPTEELSATHELIDPYVSGGEAVVIVEIAYTGALQALAVDADLPAGYAVTGVGGVDPPDGFTAEGEFFWIIPPPTPVSFTYAAFIPENVTGAQEISARVKYRRMADEMTATVMPDPLVLGDLDEDGDVDRDDIALINQYRGQLADIFPAADIDQDGEITGLDARKLLLICTCPRCLCD